MEEYKLFDAEYRLMDLVWSLEPVNSTALARRCEEAFGWKKSTAFNLIRKLGERGFLRNDHATVTALVKREQVRQYESAAVVERGFGGSLPAFRLCGGLFEGQQAVPGGGRGAAADDRRKRGAP